MKKYEKPEVQVCVFTSEDFITASGLVVKNFTQGENQINF